MVSVATKSEVSTAQEEAAYTALFNRGALTVAQVAAAMKLDEATVEAWLDDKARGRVIDFDPRFGRYATFE